MSGAAAVFSIDDDGEAVKLPKPRLPNLRVPKVRIPFAGGRRSVWFNGILVVTLLGLVGGGYALTSAKSASVTSSETVSTAKTGIVLSSVSATGNVESPDDLGVNFQQSGRVVSIAVQPGQHVDAGAELARIDDVTQQSALASAQAQLASARAQLASKRKGQTDAEKAQDAAGLAQAQLSIDSADKALARAKASANLNVTKYQLQVDQAAAQVDSATVTAAANSGKYDLAVQQAEDQYDEAQSNLSNASQALSDARTTLQALQSSYDPSASSGETASSLVSRYQADQSSCQANASNPGYTPSDGVDCDHVGDLLQRAQSYSSAESSYDQASNAASSAERAVASAQQSRSSGELQDQQQIDSAKRSLDTAKLNQSSGLLQDQQQIETSEGSLSSTRASYASTVASNQVKAEGTPEEIAQAQASVASAQNQVDSAQRNVEDTILRAPTAGTVGSVSGQVGEYTGSGGSASSSSSSSSSSASSTSSTSSTSGFVVLTNLDHLDVKVGFTETDAVKVRVGQDATIAIDAIGGDTLEGTVVSLDVNQTVVNNVVTYYAKVAFGDEPESVKPGMTASVSVVLDKREDVVTLPTAAVSTQGTTAAVTVRSQDGTESQRTIGIGLRGDNAVEITSGLEAGEAVVTRTTTAGGGGNNFGPPGGGGGIGGGIGGGGPP